MEYESYKIKPITNTLRKTNMNSSEIQSSQVPHVENSVQSLIKTWKKRQKLEHFLSSRKHGDGLSPWREQLINILESNSIRIVTIVLLLVDLVLTSIELSLSLLSCKAKSNKINEKTEENWFHFVAIAILSVLCVKIFGLVFALGRSFFRRPGYVLDGIVVVVALVLEVYLVKGGGGLVVVVSLWRIVRVVETAFEITDETIEAKIAEIVCQFESLKDENMRLQEIIVEKDLVIEKLEEEIGMMKING